MGLHIGFDQRGSVSFNKSSTSVFMRMFSLEGFIAEDLQSAEDKEINIYVVNGFLYFTIYMNKRELYLAV